MKLSHVAGGNAKWYSHHGKNAVFYQVDYMTKQSYTICPRNSENMFTQNLYTNVYQLYL